MKKKPGFSLGTILALCLTVAVTVGCIFLFGKIRGSNSNVRMDAQRVLGVMGAMIQTSTDAHIVSDRRNRDGIPYIIHLNGTYQKEREDNYLAVTPDTITGHYRVS